MIKRLQNRIAESGTIFFVSAFYTVVIWLVSGCELLHNWLQICCLILSAYLMREFTNNNSLIRIRTQLVSSIFLILSAATPALFASTMSYAIDVCMIASLFLLFKTYQNEHSTGYIYFAFTCLGIASLLAIQVLYFVPILWLLTLTQLQSFNWRTWSASVLGLLTPYWICSPWIVFTSNWHLTATHFEGLTTFGPLFDYSQFSFNEMLFLILVIILSLISFIDFWQKSFLDSIRTRQFFGFFYILFVFALVLLSIRPDLHEIFIPVITACAAPLIAHFFALTHSKVTNILFIVSIVFVLFITLTGLVPALDTYLSQLIDAPWIGS